MEQTRELDGKTPAVPPVGILNGDSKSTPLVTKVILIIFQFLILFSIFYMVKSFIFPSNIKSDHSYLLTILAALLAVYVAFFMLAKFQLILQEFTLKSDKMEQHVNERNSALQKINEQMRFEINERNRVEAALNESEGRFRTIIREAAIGIAIIDKNGWVHESNPALQLMLGYSPQELKKVSFNELLVSKDALKSKVIFNELIYGYRTNVQTEKRFVRKDGKICWGRQSISLVRDSAGEPQFFIAMVEDVTERRLAEEEIRGYQEQLQSLASELSLSEERERRTMAEGLHDHIGQLLSMAKMKLEELQDSAVYRKMMSPIKEVHKMIEKSISYTRSLMFELSPPILYDVGFEATVEWLAEQIRDKHHLHVEVKANGQTHQLDNEMRGLLFRAFRELLLNVIKHAQASRVQVEIQRVKTNLQISVSDDGRGFQEKDAISTKAKQGFGLFSIRERITYFGGRMDIESHPGQGTRVTLTMPLKNRKNKGGGQKVSVASLPSRVYHGDAPVKEVAAN